MHVITIVSLLCIVVFGTAASLKKGDEKLMDDIKKCYKAAKTLQNDPGDDKKTKEFLSNCEKFLKDIKLSEVQKTALKKIGYNVDNLFSEKGFALDLEEKDDTEKLNQSGQSTKVSEEPPSKEEKVTGNKAHVVIPEKNQIPDEKETEISLETEDGSEDEPKNTQQKESLEGNIDIKSEVKLDTDIEEKLEKQQTTDQQNIEIPSKPQDVPVTPGETFGYQAIDGAFNQPPIFYPNADGFVQDNRKPEAMEFNPNFAQAQVYQQAWPQVNPAIPAQPVIHNIPQQQGIPIHGIPSDIPWNQQAAPNQFQQQQAFPNPQFFNQPLDGLHNPPGNIPINNFQGNAFYGNPQQPQQHVPFNAIPDNFGSVGAQGQANFIPQVNIPPEQAWGAGGGGFEYGQPQQPNVQNFYAQPNEPQNQNDQQQFYGNNYPRVEL